MNTIKGMARTRGTKGNVKACRRDGFIPYVVYAQGKTQSMGMVSKADIHAEMRSIRSGFLSTVRFVLQEEGKERSVLIKDIQYHPVSYEILHLDFLELVPNHPVRCNVPVDCVNAVDCVGVKLGGMLRVLARHIKVSCLPEHIPSHFDLDVKELNLRESKRVRDLVLPEGVACLAKPHDVLVSVVKK